MMGFEPIPRFSRERILSPLRLPFRHIGVVAPQFYALAERRPNFFPSTTATVNDWCVGYL
jgi:hypothetical protein